jgi:hypothetical protein
MSLGPIVDALVTLLRGQTPPGAASATKVEAAKITIREAARGLGTDLPGIEAALRSLSRPQTALLASDRALMDVLVDDLDRDIEKVTVGRLLEERARVETFDHAELELIVKDYTSTLGLVAAAHTRLALLEHHSSIDRTGIGTVHGNQAGTPPPAGFTGRLSDCTIFASDALKAAFKTKGQSAKWDAVILEMRAMGDRDVPPSHRHYAMRHDIQATRLIAALVKECGWTATFWSPDPRNPDDRDPEHPDAYRKVRETGIYHESQIPIDKDKLVIEYRRTDSQSVTDFTGVDRLRNLPFGCFTTRGGTHVAAILNGSVYEMHWKHQAHDKSAIESTPLERFTWNSGVLAAPPGDLDLAWITPTRLPSQRP